MQQICPACSADNRDSAQFCEQCGAGLSAAADAAGEPPKTASAGRSPAVNWAALIALALIIGAVTWVVAMPGKPGDSAAPAMGNPHAEGGNPHAEAANPHAEGGNPHGEGGGMGMGDLEAAKAKLKKDPLDVETLTGLYDMYGQIGMGAKLQPFAEAAVAEWKKQNKGKDPDLKTLAGVAMATLKNGDHGGAALALGEYHKADPDNLGIVLSLGNLNFEISREFAADSKPAEARRHAQESVDWYEQYLAKASAEKNGAEYWNARIDQASMRLDLADESAKSAAFKQALASLLEVTKQAPDNWGGWHNLGLAYKLNEQQAEALAALKKAEGLAASDINKWETQKEIALLEGKPVPPSPGPVDPHEGVEMPSTPPGTPNPHGEMANPHGEMANPHGESTTGAAQAGL